MDHWLVAALAVGVFFVLFGLVLFVGLSIIRTVLLGLGILLLVAAAVIIPVSVLCGFETYWKYVGIVALAGGLGLLLAAYLTSWWGFLPFGRRAALSAAVSVAVLVAISLLLLSSFVFFGEGEGAARVVSTQPGGPSATPTPTACDHGTGEWALDESLHGEGGFIINGGLPAETEAAIDVIEAAARQDPFVLRQLLIDYRVDDVPSVEKLRCIEERRAWWLRLDGILMASQKAMVLLRDVLGLPPTFQGDVTISNSVVVNGNVDVTNSMVNVGENILVVTPPGAEPVYHRTLCANKLTPPGKGSLIIIKTDDHELPVANLLMTVTGPGGFYQQARTDGQGQVVLLDLEPGTYVVTEESLANWEPVPPFGLSASAEVKEGEPATVRFKNRQKEVMPPTPTPTPPVPTPSPSATPTPTHTPTATPSPSPSPSPSPTSTPPCTVTPSPTPTRTPTPVPPSCLVTILGPHRLDNTDTQARMQASVQWDQPPNFSPDIRWYLDGAFIGGGEWAEFMASLNTNHALIVKVFKDGQLICQDTAVFAEGSIPPGEDIPGTDPLPTETPIPAPSPTTDPDDGYQGP